MKHLKTYEANNPLEISKGDYAVINRYYFPDGLEKNCKVMDIEKPYLYYVLLETGKNSWVTNDAFKRKLTPSEIEKFEIELNTKKYNL